MRLTFLLILTTLLQVNASSSYGQQITLNLKNAGLEEVFREIMNQTDYNVLWQPDKIKAARQVTAKFTNAKLEVVLSRVLKGQPFTYTITDKTIIIKPEKKGNTIAADNQVLSPVNKVINISGHIFGENNTPLEGVTVKVKQTDRVTMTDKTGYFELRGVQNDAVLVISFIGYQSVEMKATDDLRVIKLVVASNDLKEVVVNTGYQTLPLERATGSFGVITEKMLSARMETNLIDRLEGSVPGLFIKNGTVTIRGLSTLYGNQAPLYVVDGFPYEGDLNIINPVDVVSVTVLKDAAAASIYGTRAANGVISITTRMGNARKLTVSYSSNFYITPKPDAGYLNLMNSTEMVNLQQELFNTKHPDYGDGIMRYAQPKAIEALYKFEQGQITQAQLDGTLNHLRGLNALPQVQDMLMQNMFKQQHNFSASGGNDVNQFNVTMFYLGNKGYAKGSSDDNVNIGVRDQLKVFKWLTADVGVTTNLSSSNPSPINPTGYYNNMPYEVLMDGDKISPWNYRKSQYEVDRLVGLGLFDETYNPLNELAYNHIQNKSNYIRLQGGFTAKIIDGLKLDIKYQTERGSFNYKTVNDKQSFAAKNMINDAAQVDNDGNIIYNVPVGGLIYETRGDTKAYTVRAQLNYDKTFGKNQITALAGGEQRATVVSSTTLNRLGYNDNNLQFLPVNYADLNDVKGTQSLTGSFQYNHNGNNYFTYAEDRYVSLYANAGYTYDNKYNLTGSIRVDNSNLFGTDPKYQYLPLWSVGGSWRLSNETFLQSVSWLNNLNIRATYGLNGNVAKTVGPFLQASSVYNATAAANSTVIIYPPNKSLRWERTAITNLGLDFAVLNNRVSGSFEVYKRKSTDLLGERATDPTNAFATALINYGSLTNNGFEISLNTVNIQSRDFSWSTRINYSHNKNKMTDIATRDQSVYSYTDGSGIDKIGYPMNSIFNFRWAGLDPTNGSPRVYDVNGNIVGSYDAQGNHVANMTDVNGLVYGGTLLPTYTIGFTNTFNYKKLALNVFIIANGGNVFRDAAPSILTTSNFFYNMDKRAMNFWRKPGDENIPGIMPAPDLTNSGDSYFASLWYAADINTLKADYIKVRDISLSYDFAHLLKKKFLSTARLVLQVQNAFAWYKNDKGLDPEAYAAYSISANRTLPVTPVYSVGANFTF